MSIKEYNTFKTLFGNDPNLGAYFIKLIEFVNFDGYLRREFLNARKVHFDGEGNIYFTIEHWTEFRDYELKVNYKNIDKFVPANDKRSKQLPLYLQDINFKEEILDIDKIRKNHKRKYKRYV